MKTLISICLIMGMIIHPSLSADNDVNPFDQSAKGASLKGVAYEPLEIEVPVTDAVKTEPTPWYKNKRFWYGAGICTAIVATTASVTYAIMKSLSHDEDSSHVAPILASITASISATLSASASPSPSYRPQPAPADCPQFASYTRMGTPNGPISRYTIYAPSQPMQNQLCALACGQAGSPTNRNLHRVQMACCGGNPYPQVFTDLGGVWSCTGNFCTTDHVTCSYH